jgi:hypothetical protein
MTYIYVMNALTETLIGLTDPAEAARSVHELNQELALAHEIPPGVAAAVDEIARAISRSDLERWRGIAPEFALHAHRAALEALTALRVDDPRAARSQLRLALGALAQSLWLIAEGEVVSPDRSARELARWLTDGLNVPQRELAGLVGVPLRRFQRWISLREDTRPEGQDADRLRSVAAIVQQLRHALTPLGVVAWFDWPNAQLDGRSPRELLDEPSAMPLLVAAAGSLREQGT